MSVFIGYPSFMAYQMMKGKKGNNDGFPSIPGIVARYSASGLTNEQMAANPVWKNLTGNGHDLQMKNFAWKGMSGVGGYGDENYQTFYKFTLDNYTFIASPPGVEHMNFTFRVTGLQPGNKLTLAFFGTTVAIYGTWDKDGIYTVDADIVEAGKPTYFYNGYGATRGEFTIEILPLYPGALVFDGVDDYGVCDNFPILTKEKGYTVVALRQWITRGKGALGLVSNVKNWLNNGAFLLEYRNIQADHLNKPISFGAIGSEMDLPHILTYQTSKSCNGVSITTGNFEGTDVLHVGKLAPTNVGTCINAAIWELVFLDHDATEEELTKIKDYFVKTYPWLFPDQAWTVVDKTNEDEDRATIANITGNGNDLVLSNFGFAEGSGYGLYAENYAIWTKASNRATFTVTSSKIHVTSVTAEEHADFIYTTGQQLKQKIRITGLPEGASFVIGRSGVNLKIISQDGIYDVDILDDSSANPIIGYRINRIIDSCDITIEQIPEYEGYLVTDGVDDKVESSPFTLNKDWTIVGNWTMLSNIPSNCGIIKVSSMFLYNSLDGVTIYFAGGPIKIQSKSINAFCSDGRIYLNDWTEILKPDTQIASGGSKSGLNIASYSTNFTKMAFKNLAIYDGKNLSKDDCIKAYNYLQTLKAK